MRKKNRTTDETNYWESMADSLLGLIFCILLILILLILFIIRNDGNDKVDYTLGDTYTDYDGGGYDETNPTVDDDDDYHVIATEVYHDGGDGNGDGDGDDDFPDPYPGQEGEGIDKAAVYVQVVDGETNRTIKQRGIQFELYTARRVLEILNTYYPDKVEYKKYETDDAGVFYLPEKLNLDGYFFKNLTTVTGYDKAENVEFNLEQSYDWPEPYVVTIPLFPSKNIIRVQLRDADTGANLSGSAFHVIAAEDIRTKDDTLRYEKGEIVDTIKLDETGYGESIQLYLGNYTLAQSVIPRYYAKTEDVAVRVADKSKGTALVTEVSAQKTAVLVTVEDALYSTTRLEQSGFVLQTKEKSVNYVSDEDGSFCITNLEKNMTYQLKQTKSRENYYPDTEIHSFTVDADGKIEEQIVSEMYIDNLITRLSFGICDFLLRGQISDVNLALYNASDDVVRIWDSTGLEQQIEGLETGEYLLVMRGRKENGHSITVEQVPDIQYHTYYLWTTVDTCIVIILGIFLIVCIILLVRFIKRKIQKKREKKGEFTVNA